MTEPVKLGDIFWDIPTWIYYTKDFDLGCTIYVANNTDTDREYALISHTYKNGVLQSEGVLRVYDYTWFPVSSGDFVKLHGTMKLGESDVILTVSLMEKDTQAAIDSISTTLVTPTAAVMPPGWNIPGVTGGTDLMSMIMMVMVMIMMMKMASSAIGSDEKKKELAPQEV
jgi:hypothetical protein